jgi:hypothetical protein
MSANEASQPQSPAFEQRIRNRIVERTGGRVRALEVDHIEDRVVVHGCTASYYLKQLALEAVLEVVGHAGAGGVEFDIRVADSFPKPNVEESQ